MSKTRSRLEDQLLEQLIIKARDDFYTYVRLMAPAILPDGFTDGVHIRKIAKELEAIVRSVEAGEPEKLQVMLPPGAMKSRLSSQLLPSWALGRNPNWCVLAIGSDQDFAIDNFGRPTKEIIDSDRYKAIFPNTLLKKDVQSAGRWQTTRKGVFVAKGVGQSIAGRRAHLLIVDDAITEQTTDTGRKEINKWYLKGARTRLLPRGAEIIVNTRWFLEDLSGFLLKVDGNSERPWKVIRIPALLDERASAYLREGLPEDDPRFSVGTSFWPEFWPTKLFLERKSVMIPSEWAALFMQEPVAEDGGIVKKSDWQIWTHPNPPDCKYVILSIDTAFSTNEYADYSAYTVWGVFTQVSKDFNDMDVSLDCMILLAAGKGRWDFAELCRKVRELDGKFQPDYVIIEDKASGQSLIPEMRKWGLPIVAYKPDRDKASRLQATTPYFQAKRVWVPDGKAYSEELIEEVCSFSPRLKNQRDDLTDCTTQAILWMRDLFKIDNEGYSNRWMDEEEYGRIHQRSTYWSAMMSG